MNKKFLTARLIKLVSPTVVSMPLKRPSQKGRARQMYLALLIITFNLAIASARESVCYPRSESFEPTVITSLNNGQSRFYAVTGDR